jgi:hypothetical protein
MALKRAISGMDGSVDVPALFNARVHTVNKCMRIKVEMVAKPTRSWNELSVETRVSDSLKLSISAGFGAMLRIVTIAQYRNPFLTQYDD